MTTPAIAFKPIWPFGTLVLFYLLSLVNFFSLANQGVEGSSLKRVQRDRLVPAERGQILDRNGLVLAEDRGAWSLVVNFLPEHRSVIKNTQNGVWDSAEVLRRLEPISIATQLSVEELYDAIMVNSSASQLLLTNLAPIDRERIASSLKALPYSGLTLVQKFQRVYPNGPVLSHLIGLLGSDEDGRDRRHGASGLEFGLNEHLAGSDGRSSAIGVGRGHGTNPALAKIAAQPGASITTTLDSNISHFARRQLVELMEKHDPMHCLAIVVDVNNGEILSLQGLPDYNPNSPLESMDKIQDPESGEDVYLGWTFPGKWRISPGSTLKPLVAAWALENKAIKPNQMFSNMNGAYRLSGRVIHNSSKYRNEDMNFATAVVHSSNIVMAQIGRALGRELMADFLPQFGYQDTAAKLPGSGIRFQDGVYPRREDFLREKGPNGMVFTIPSISFGREIEVPLIDHAMALASLANGGKVLQARLNPGQEPVVVANPISPQVASLVSSSMHDMVMYEPRKWLPHRNDLNYCGKSGTSQHRSGPAKDKYTSLFTAFGPLEDPDVLVLVVAFGTHGAKENYYGSQVCGPAAANILQYALKSRGTTTVAPLESGMKPANLDQ